MTATRGGKDHELSSMAVRSASTLASAVPAPCPVSCTRNRGPPLLGICPRLAGDRRRPGRRRQPALPAGPRVQRPGCGRGPHDAAGRCPRARPSDSLSSRRRCDLDATHRGAAAVELHQRHLLLGELLADGEESAFVFDEGIHQGRVKVLAALSHDHAPGDVGGKRRFVHAFRGQGVVDIRQGDNPRG